MRAEVESWVSVRSVSSAWPDAIDAIAAARSAAWIGMNLM
jgi:hypothetical protein